MDCREVQKKFIPFIDDELNVTELYKFLKHLRECEECREEYNIYYTMIMGMRYLESDNNKTEFKINSDQKLRYAQDYLIKYRIIFIEKVVLFIVLCIGAILLL